MPLSPSSAPGDLYLVLAGEEDWHEQRVPAYVEREVRHYLECGSLAYGFARRMAETAAHLVDHVILPLPVRQLLLS